MTILGGVRPDGVPGKYQISSLTADAPAVLTVFQARLQFWGSPTDASHDKLRGACLFAATPGTACPVPRTEKPLISLPTSCTKSMQAEAHVDLWEEKGHFYDRAADLTDANGNSTPVANCREVRFEPTLRARPTTSLADSPTGLEVDLKVPQTDSLEQPATAHLRDAVVTLPQGISVNASSANGLAGCKLSQIGIDPATGAPDESPVSCPAASRIGSVEVDTPLLDHALPGSVYVATPHDNPFDSLLAIYVVLEDPTSGVLAKLAGHVVADPDTGRLVTTFSDRPYMPFSEFKLRFFSGAYAALKTPAACGDYETTSELTPWSAPESGPPATPSDPWSITQSPAGSCAASESGLPQSASFEAGSASPVAGAYTPFVLRLSREDGTQRLSSVTVSPPPGLLAKLAGTTECPEAALAAAEAKSGRRRAGLAAPARSPPASAA